MKDLSEKQIYRFGQVKVDLFRNCVLLEGEEKHLRQKAFQVLIYLLENRERLVSKDELFEKIWHETAVTDDVLVQCVKEIRRAIGDDSHQPRYIKTVPKAGYRFIGEVGTFIEEFTQFEVEIEEEFESQPPPSLPPNKPNFFQNYRILLAFALVAICLSAIGFYFYGRSNPAKTEVRLPVIEGKKTVAVMFFENKSETKELDWLREGLTDMLIADLSRSEKLTVLSRAALQNFLENRNLTKVNFDETVEITQIVQADFLITGSFAVIGERLRLDVQLFETKTKNLLTSESLIVEKPEQILSEIDLLSLKISHQLDAPPIEKPSLGLGMTNNLEAYRYYSLALEKASGVQAKEALELLEKAIALDNEFAMAHARIGYIYAVVWGRADKAKPHLEKAFSLFSRLTEKDRLYITAWYAAANLDFPAGINAYREIIQKFPTETEAYWRLGLILRGEEKFEEAILVLRQGLAIDANYPSLHNALGGTYSLLGRHAEAIAEHERFVTLKPNEANPHDSLGLSYQWAGEYEKAIAEYKRALQLNPNFEIAQVHLGNAYFQSGRYQEAIEAFKKYIAIAPSKLERSRGFACLSQVYRRQGDLTAALEAASQAAQEEPLQVSELYLLAADRRDWATTEKLKGKVFADTFSGRGARQSLRIRFYFLGYLALKKGETETALENFREALRNQPLTWNIDSYEDCLANAYLEIGRYDEAIIEYRRILQLNPNYPLAFYNLARSLQAKGSTEEAKTTYQKFLEVWKSADANIPEVILANNYLKQ